VIVVYAGRIVEEGSTRDVFTRPAHPYTEALLNAMPRDDGTPLASLKGAPPSLSPPPPGCAFAARCPRRVAACAEDPPAVEIEPGRRVACWVAAGVPEDAR
jgi:oligopeptide/dipeptide ABC transporter ATP-binding protein